MKFCTATKSELAHEQVTPRLSARGILHVRRRILERLLPSLILVLVGVASAYDTPVTPGASRQAQSLLAFLWSVHGQKILAGQHESRRGTNQLGFELRYILDATGKLPAIRSMDFVECTGADSITPEETPEQFLQHAINWYLHSNGIVMLCWHWPAPISNRAFYTRQTRFDPARAVTEGTPEYAAVINDMDKIATMLKVLRDAGVAVLWRPLHEANGRWFWWGAKGPDTFKKLWRLMFNRFVNRHKLNNLLWVYSPGAAVDLADWYPGDAYVDIIGQDHYPLDGNHEPAKDIYDELAALRGGTKLVGLSETGPIPDLDKLVEQKANWFCFVTWAGRVLTRHNSKDQLRAAYNHPHVLTLEQLPDLKRFPYPRAGKPVRLGFPVQIEQMPLDGPGRTPVIVAVQDANGRTVRTGKFNVTIALANKPNRGRPAGRYTARVVNGVAEFSDMKIAEPGNDYVLVATARGVRPARSAHFSVGPGRGLLREWWLGLPSLNAADLDTLSVPPSGREILGKAFEVPFVPVTNYAARLRGYIIPPLTGQYVFWLASLNSAELQLGTNAAPESKQTIARVTANTPYAKWPHTNEAQSEPVTLQAGTRYYIQVLQKQSTGSAHLSVRWRLPDGREERPIPAWRLEPVEP